MTSLRDTTADAAEAAMREVHAAQESAAGHLPVTLSAREAVRGLEAVDKAIAFLTAQRKTTLRDRDLARRLDATLTGLIEHSARLSIVRGA